MKYLRRFNENKYSKEDVENCVDSFAYSIGDPEFFVLKYRDRYQVYINHSKKYIDSELFNQSKIVFEKRLRWMNFIPLYKIISDSKLIKLEEGELIEKCKISNIFVNILPVDSHKEIERFRKESTLDTSGGPIDDIDDITTLSGLLNR